MEQFLTPARLWPESSRLHVYVLPDTTVDTTLGGLCDSYRRVCDSYPFLAPVPPQWMHMTLQAIVADGADVDPGLIGQLVTALTDQAAGVAPFTVTAGPALAGVSGVVLDIDDPPGQPLEDLWNRVRAAIGRVFGPQTVTADTRPFHASLAYGIGDGDSGRVQARLRRVRPARAPWTVDRVWLLDVSQDAEPSNHYTWRQVGCVPLRGRA